MLYSTIPPILIILSLAGIIIFFMKKAPQIARLKDEDEFEEEGMSEMNGAGFLGKIIWKIKNINGSGIKHALLFFSEKLTRQARIIFLRLESKSKSLNDLIRDKRNRHRAEKKLPAIEKNEEDVIMEKINEYQPKKKSYLAEMKNVLKKETVAGRRKRTDDADSFARASADKDEKIIKPMVSDRVATPSNRAEMKDRLEDLLIERIAANPKDTEAYERLGEYYMEIDSLNDAKECFKQVLKLDAKNRNVKYRMRVLETMMQKR